MIEHRDRNCSTSPVYLTTFYREGVQLKNKFQSLTEAVFKVYKSPTMEPGQKDQVKLLKMSKIDNRGADGQCACQNQLRGGGMSAVGHHEESSRLPLAGIRRGTLYLYFGRHRIGGRPYCQRRLF